MFKATQENKLTGKIVPNYHLSHSTLFQAFSDEKEYSVLNNTYANNMMV